MGTPRITTDRLLLRRWRDGDRAAFAAMNADPQVMRYFPRTATRAESDAFIDRMEISFEQQGFGFWAVEMRESGAFIGFVGLAVPGFEAPFTPCVEIGWRLVAHAWNQGFATEAARASLAFGFESLDLPSIVAFTAVPNAPSRRVMEKLGMTRNPADDFDHPRIAAGHPLRRHVLYRIDRARFAAVGENTAGGEAGSVPGRTQ
jgi:RimJ/RimL family protein N-acetyltransferase